MVHTRQAVRRTRGDPREPLPVEEHRGQVVTIALDAQLQQQRAVVVVVIIVVPVPLIAHLLGGWEGRREGRWEGRRGELLFLLQDGQTCLVSLVLLLKH